MSEYRCSLIAGLDWHLFHDHDENCILLPYRHTHCGLHSANWLLTPPPAAPLHDFHLVAHRRPNPSKHADTDSELIASLPTHEGLLRRRKSRTSQSSPAVDRSYHVREEQLAGWTAEACCLLTTIVGGWCVVDPGTPSLPRTSQRACQAKGCVCCGTTCC